MSLWIVVVASVVQLGFGGSLSFGLIFWACAQEKSLSNLTNNIVVALWMLFGFSLFVSVGLVIYGYATDKTSVYYWWLLMPWIVFGAMTIVWNLPFGNEL